MIKQAKFIFSPLGKAFQKQTKTIKDQEEKQIEVVKENKKQVADIDEDYKNKLLFSKEKEIFKNIFNEKPDKIEELNERIIYNNQRYIVISTGKIIEFDESEDSLIFSNDIKTGKISLEEAKNLQKDYNEYLNKIIKGNKNEGQKKLILFNAGNNVIKFIEDYSSMILESKNKSPFNKVPL